MKVELDKEFELLVQRKVSSGRYANAASVVQKALRELDERDERLEYLRAAIAVGEADVAAGRLIDWTPELMDQIQAEADEEDRLGLPIEGHELA